MKRKAKIFLEVDKEGLLTDTLAIIADVVSFDCYESIMSSCQRVIGAFKNVLPEDIHIKRLFYYKRRARSSRMNPVRILNTTDVFRAVAEHPDGDLPIGVIWEVLPTHRPGSKKPKTEPVGIREEHVSLTELRGHDESRRPNVGEKRSKDASSDVANKKRKTDLSQYKTYMPEGMSLKVPNIILTPVSNIGITTTSGQSILGKQGPSGESQTSDSGRTQPDSLTDQTEDRSSMPSKTKVPYEPKGKADISQYQWPSDIQCELVMTYGGISERQALPVSLTTTVLNMVKDHFNTNPISKYRIDKLVPNYESVSSQRMVDEMNAAIRDRMEENRKKKVPIKYLQDAKMEVFKLLSQLTLSKARFENFLEWLKTLSLEEGKQGKFFLAERNRIGTGMKVQYDTDEDAAKRLNQIYRSRVKSMTNKKLHPVELLSTPGVTPGVPKTALDTGVQAQKQQPQQPLMFLVPTSGNPGGQMMPPNMQVVTSAPIPAMPVIPTSTFANNTHSANSTDASTQEPQDESSSSKKKSHPAILRRKRTAVGRGNKPMVETSVSNSDSNYPIPMQLYKSGSEIERPQPYNDPDAATAFDVENTIIKTEPVSFSDAEEENNMDDTNNFSDSKDSVADGYNDINQVLKTDVKMDQGLEPHERRFELVTVKSEPIDDF